MLASSSAETLYDQGCDRGDAISGVQESTECAPQIIVRPTTASDVIEYWGGTQRGTIKAFSALIDGRVVGVLGIIREGPIGKFFCDISPELQPHLRSITIMRAIKASIEMVKDYRGPIVAVAEHAEGCRLLNRLGFTHLDGVYYTWLK